LAHVYKFGGSTIRCATTLDQIASIISENKDLRFVVLSATYNTTNELEIIHDTESVEFVSQLFRKHEELAKELNIFSEINLHFESLQSELLSYLDQKKTAKRLDAIYSVGERLSSYLLYFLLRKKQVPCQFLDAREVIKTNSEYSQAGPILFDIKNGVAKLDNNILYITQGFIGSNAKGETTTLGREGSDYTASLLAWAVDAQSMTVWKDVDGIYQADPKRFKKACRIKNLSYEQAEAMTVCGAKVLFSRTMSPLKEKGIRLYVRGLDLNDEGSLISYEKGTEKSIALNGNVVSIIGDGLFENSIADELKSNFHKHEITFEIYQYSNQVLSFWISKPHLENCISLLDSVVFGK
jgi:aspartate kinase